MLVVCWQCHSHCTGQVEAAVPDPGFWLSPFQTAGRATQQGFGSSTGCAHAWVPKHPAPRMHAGVVTRSLIQAACRCSPRGARSRGNTTHAHPRGTAPASPREAQHNSWCLHRPWHWEPSPPPANPLPCGISSVTHSCQHHLQGANFS